MFKIIEGDFKNNKYSDEEYLDNWPMLYILENGRQAYIGESSHVKTRMTQHSSIEEKRIFDKVHFIYSKLFNQSVTFDYESKLIQYIAADELYEVTNKNKGIADKQYYQKQEYDEKFATLWRKLQREKLVKHSIEEIENSDLFKYSPYKELNDSQRQAVEDILLKLKEGTVDKVVVNGMPGSGKTIVAVYLMNYLADSEEYAGKQIGFVVPQTSLRKTMKLIFRSIYGLSPSQVLSPSDVTKKKYDILLVDEAHRLHQYKNISYMGTFKANCEKLGLATEADELDWILMQSDQAVLFYDSMQVVGPSGIDFERFDKKMEDSFNRRMIAYFTLLTQMRVQGGNAYIDQVKDMLAGNCSSKYVSEKYDFKLYADFSKFEKDMYAKENEVGLSRMLAGYAWPWISKNDQTIKDIADLEDGVATYEADCITVNQLWNKYINQKHHLKTTTKANYIYTYEHFVKDSFGNMKLGKVKYTHVKDFYYELIEEDDLEIATLDNINTLLHPMFDIAVRDGLIRTNPTDGVMNEIKKANPGWKNKRHALTIPQQRNFVNFIDEHDTYEGGIQFL